MDTRELSCRERVGHVNEAVAVSGLEDSVV